MATTDRRKLVLWVRLDGNGDVIPGSEQYRPLGVRPRDGRWKQAIGSYCCSCNCLITFQNTATVGDITSIVSADGAIDWTGTLSTNGTISFVIPNCYDEVFTVGFGTITSSGVDINATTVQGTGTAVLSTNYLASGTGRSMTISTPADGCAQYLISISND